MYNKTPVGIVQKILPIWPAPTQLLHFARNLAGRGRLLFGCLSSLVCRNKCTEIAPRQNEQEDSTNTVAMFEMQNIIEGSLEVKLPTIWTDEKQSREEAERRERLEERRIRRKKVQMREKVGKSRNTVFFQ